MSDDYVKAAPLCEKHQPNGGTRGMCVICAGESLQHALSRISYACEPPNEMQCSSFDVHMDETAVVTQVVAQAERIRVLEGEVARMKTVPMKYRRMEFNAQLQHENATLTERIRVLRDALEKLTACKAVEIRLRQLHEMGHGTDYDQHRQQFADAWMKARAVLERTQ